MAGEHPVCNEHSGLVAQVKIVCEEMQNSTKAVNELCVEIRGLVVKNEHIENDINNLGQIKADKETTKNELKAIKKNVGLLQWILYGSLGVGIVVGIILGSIKASGGG